MVRKKKNGASEGLNGLLNSEIEQVFVHLWRLTESPTRCKLVGNKVNKPIACLMKNKLYKIDKRIAIILPPNFKTSKNENNLLEIKEL